MRKIYVRKQHRGNVWKVARRRKSWTTLNFSFTLGTFASVLFTCVNVRSQKRVMEINLSDLVDYSKEETQYRQMIIVNSFLTSFIKRNCCEMLVSVILKCWVVYWFNFRGIKYKYFNSKFTSYVYFQLGWLGKIIPSKHYQHQLNIKQDAWGNDQLIYNRTLSAAWMGKDTEDFFLPASKYLKAKGEFLFVLYWRQPFVERLSIIILITLNWDRLD